MAKSRIQGITVEINGDTTKLSKALEGVNKNIRNTQTQLKDVEKLLKLDPTNTELLAQKQKLLASEVSSAKDKLETLKKASEEAAKTKDNYDAWKAKYDPIKQKITETEDKLKSLKEQSKIADEQLSKGEISQEKYNSIQNEIKSTSDELKNLKKSAQDVSDEFGNPISSEQFDSLQREIVDTQQELQRLQNEADKSRTALVKIGEAGETLQNVGGKISNAGQSLMPVTAVVAGAGLAGAKSFAEVDKTMRLTNKTMGNSADEAEYLNNVMKNAASNSIFTMNDASNAVLNFARAGLKAEAAASTLTQALNLAAGEGGDLTTVSAGLIATLKSFHESFSEAENYADIFASACNNSSLEINSLSESMSVAAPVFSAAGYDIGDTVLAMGLMGDAGYAAEVSATSLKTGISRLIGPTKAGASALLSMGFGSDDTAEKEAKLAEAQKSLKKKVLH